MATERIKLKTPRFRGSFPHLDKPQAMDDAATPKYSIAALFPKTTDLKEMKAAAFKAGKEMFGDKWKSEGGKWPAGFRNPFRDGNDKSDLPGYENTLFATLSANVDYPPLVLDKDVTRLDPTDPSFKAKIYPGAWYVATVNVYAYGNTKGAKNKGVAFGLLGIQLVKDDDRLGGGGGGGDVSDFEAVADESDNAENYSDDAGDVGGGW